MTRISEKELKKLYYSIGEVADMFEVNTSLIRFWEKEFQNVKPKKNNKGNRLFTAKDIIQLDRIYNLVKEQGYTLDGAKKSLKDKSEKVENDVANSNGDVLSKLEEIKKILVNLKS